MLRSGSALRLPSVAVAFRPTLSRTYVTGSQSSGSGFKPQGKSDPIEEYDRKTRAKPAPMAPINPADMQNIKPTGTAATGDAMFDHPGGSPVPPMNDGPLENKPAGNLQGGGASPHAPKNITNMPKGVNLEGAVDPGWGNPEGQSSSTASRAPKEYGAASSASESWNASDLNRPTATGTAAGSLGARNSSSAPSSAAAAKSGFWSSLFGSKEPGAEDMTTKKASGLEPKEQVGMMQPASTATAVHQGKKGRDGTSRGPSTDGYGMPWPTQGG
jgi:hypothetical protein